MIRPRPRRRWPWFMGLTALILVVLIQTGASILRSEWMERQVTRVVETAIEYATGEQAVIGGLEISPALGRVDIEGLVLTHISADQALSGHTIVAVERIGVVAGTGLGGWLRRLEIERPVVRLHLDEDGLREFRDATSSDEPSSEFPWSDLVLRDATFVLEMPNGSLEIEGINSVPGDGEDRMDISIQSVHVSSGGIDEVARDLEFPGVQLTPQRLWLPTIDVQTDALSVKGSLAAIVNGPLGGDLSVSLQLPLLDALVSPPTRFEGVAHLDASLGGTVAEPHVEGVLLVDDVFIHDENHFGEPSLYEIERTLLDFHVQDRWVTVDNGRIDWAMGQVVLSGTYDLQSTAIQAVVFPNGVDLAEAVRQAGGVEHAWTTFTGEGEVNVAGTLSPVNVQGTMDIALADFWVGNGPIRAPSTERLLTMPRGQVKGQIGITADGIRLHGKQTVVGATSGDVNAYIGFDWFGPLDIKVDVDRTNLATFRPLKDLNLLGVGGVRGTISGPFQDIRISGAGQFANFEVLGIPFADEVRTTVECNDRTLLRFGSIDARKGQTHYRGDVTATIADDVEMGVDLFISEGRIADLLNIVGAADGSVDGGVSGIIALEGDPYAMSGDVNLELDRVDLLGERFSTGGLVGWMDAGLFTLDNLSLSRWSGDEGVVVRGTIGAGWETNLDVAATGLRLDRLDAFAATKLPIRGTVFVDGRIGGTLFNPEPHGRVAVRDTWYAGRSVPDSTAFFETFGNRLQLEGYLLGQGLGFVGRIDMSGDYAYDVNLNLERFPLHTALPIAADGGEVEAWLSGTVQARGELSSAISTMDITARGEALDIGWNRHRIKSVQPWSYTQHGRVMALEGLRLNGEQTDLRLAFRTDEEDHIQLDGMGTVELDLARIFVPDLARAEGVAAIWLRHGANGGTVQMDVATCDVTLRGEWFPATMDSMAMVLRANRDGFSFRALDPTGDDQHWVAKTPMLRRCVGSLSQPELTATVGDGRLVASGGILADRWQPTRFDLKAHLDNGTVQYFDFLPEAVGDADLVLEGEVDDLLMSGRVAISEMVFSERIVWEEWLLEVDDERLGGVEEQEEPLFDLDVTIDAPSTIRMRNNVADLTATASLRVVGDTASPGLVGDVRTEHGGRVHLKEREFELQRGEIRFVDPLTYDPDLDIVLRTDVRARDDTYDVEYRVVGTYEDWRAETSSDPPLESADINALLLFGMTRDELERYGGLGGALAVEGGDLLASRMLFSSRTGNERGGLFRIVDPLRPDRLDLVSGVSERGSGLVSSDLRLLYENELDDVSLPGTLMIFEQNITRATDTYLGLEQRLARKLYARSYWASEQRGRHLPIGGAYGLEVKVRWELD